MESRRLNFDHVGSPFVYPLIMTGGRLDKPWETSKAAEGSGADPTAARFVASLSFDRRLYKHDITGSIAHARMLRDVGLISPDDLEQIEGGLRDIGNQIDRTADAWPGWRVELEDVHMCIEAALIEKIGDAGRKLHTGRSRNDQVALDLKLWLQEATGALRAKFAVLFAAFVDLAERDGRLVMPAYTHLQRAQPIVAGSELLAWAEAFDRALQRFEALGRVNRSNPLGSGAVAGSGLPIDRNHTARALGVGPASASSIDATSHRDAAIDFVYALAMTAMTLSRLSEQWILYASNEFGFLKLDAQHTTGSSMMPQKRNPDLLELIRGRCGGVYGDLVALLTICKGLPVGYCRDLQLDKQHLFRAYDSVSDCLEMVAAVVRGAGFDADRIAARLDEGFLDATSLAEYLVVRGVPFRTAHQIVGRLVQRCEQQGLAALKELGEQAVNDECAQAGAGRPCGMQLEQWLGAANVVRRYQSSGSAGLSGFETLLDAWKRRVVSDRT